MIMMLPDVIGHENQSQHCPDHRCLCLVLSGRITTPDGFSYHTGPRPMVVSTRGASVGHCAVALDCHRKPLEEESYISRVSQDALNRDYISSLLMGHRVSTGTTV